MNQEITRYCGISSTAEGYDFIIAKTFVDYQERIHKTYKNITAASMKRFYSLSNRSSDYYKTKKCHWTKFRSVRHNL